MYNGRYDLAHSWLAVAVLGMDERALRGAFKVRVPIGFVLVPEGTRETAAAPISRARASLSRNSHALYFHNLVFGN